MKAIPLRDEKMINNEKREMIINDEREVQIVI